MKVFRSKSVDLMLNIKKKFLNCTEITLGIACHFAPHGLADDEKSKAFFTLCVWLRACAIPLIH